MIKEEKLDSYNPRYETTVSLDKQNIKRETLSMIALLHLNYWCKSEEEKEELRNLFKYNEENHQAELREKYNPDNIFKTNIKKNDVNENINKPEKAMVKYKENIFKKLFNKIKRIFY